MNQSKRKSSYAKMSVEAKQHRTPANEQESHDPMLANHMYQKQCKIEFKPDAMACRMSYGTPHRTKEEQMSSNSHERVVFRHEETSSSA